MVVWWPASCDRIQRGGEADLVEGKTEVMKKKENEQCGIGRK
jgi:hypothetical protein